jgi:phosphoribosylanthranilate isomerase
MTSRIKICGVKDPKNISKCNDLGIDFIGFNFADVSPRKLSPREAKENNLASYCKKIDRVAVFVDPSDQHLDESIRSIDATYIQLHGNESSQRCSDIKKLFDLPVIKAFGINSALDLNAAAHYENVVDYFLFDAKPDIKNIKQKGGLNKVFNWKILDNWKGKEFFLAGGININNIKSAINDTNAFCIDISSGVEKALGIKDSNMIKEIYTEFKALL